MTEDDDTTLPELLRPADPGLPDADRTAGATAGVTPLPGVVPAGAVPPVEGRRRRRWWPWVILGVVIVAVVVANMVDLDYYAVQPGTAQSVQQFITVPPSKRHPVTHPVLLTDVEIGRVSALNYLVYRLQGDTELDSVGAITGGTPPSELGAQGDLEMSQAEAAAKTAALRRLGYQVTAHAGGAVVYAIYEGTPAWGVLDVGDVITAVDGTPTPTVEAFHAALGQHRPGQTVTLSVRKGGTGTARPVSITLKRSVIVDETGTKETVDLGIEIEDQVDHTYPFPVSIDVTNIGGPSAGLAMTLGVIDELTGGSLTGGKTVAATGTMDDQGTVGDVGGVPQKTVAVENAGASIFLVPPEEYQAAKSKDRPGLQIYPVSSLDQALAVLAAHGGAVPPAPAAHPPGTASPAAGG